jgi:hypothetical protein
MTDPARPPDPDLDDPRPWELPGAVRRDVAPHRGNVLLLLARVALAIGALSFFLVPFVVAAVPLALAVQKMARRDWVKMRTGATDPGGLEQTEAALRLSALACGVGVVGAVCGLVWWAYLSRHL